MDYEKRNTDLMNKGLKPNLWKLDFSCSILKETLT